MKRTVQAVFVCLAAFALPAPVQALNLVEDDKSVSGSVQFERPARVCALAQVDPTLIALVEGRSETELQSIAKTPSNLSSEIEETVKSEMRNGGDAALYDTQGKPILQIFDSEDDAFGACIRATNAVVLRIVLTNAATGKPYHIVAIIKQNDKQISEVFERNALEELNKYYGSAVLPDIPGQPYLRPGIGWSVNWDTRRLLTALFDRVNWTNYGPYGNRQP